MDNLDRPKHVNFTLIANRFRPQRWLSNNCIQVGYCSSLLPDTNGAERYREGSGNHEYLFMLFDLRNTIQKSLLNSKRHTCKKSSLFPWRDDLPQQIHPKRCSNSATPHGATTVRQQLTNATTFDHLDTSIETQNILMANGALTSQASVTFNIRFINFCSNFAVNLMLRIEQANIATPTTEFRELVYRDPDPEFTEIITNRNPVFYTNRQSEIISSSTTPPEDLRLLSWIITPNYSFNNHADY
nr:hypothetical transcript [Hymenolepis microstoma]